MEVTLATMNNYVAKCEVLREEAKRFCYSWRCPAKHAEVRPGRCLGSTQKGSLMEKHYSPKDLAAALGVAKKTVERWCRTGAVKAFKDPGGKWRISATSVQDLQRTQGHD